MRNRTVRMALLSLIAAAPALAASATQVLVNGGFEAGAQAWQVGSEARICDNADPTCGLGSAHGTHYLWLYNTILGSGSYAEQVVTVPAGRRLQFRRRKYSCGASSFSVTFTPAGGSATTLFSEPTSTGCPGLYETYRVNLAGLAGQSGKLRFQLTGGPSITDLLVDDVALVPVTIKGDFNLDRAADLLFATPGLPAACELHDLWYMSEAQRLGVGAVSTTCLGVVRGVDDFDGDGDNDLAAVEYPAGRVWMYFLPPGLQGNGQVLAPLLGPDWILAATGDFNNDAHPDLLWRSTVTQKLQIWTLDGAANYVSTIVPNPDSAVDANWGVVAALDVDDDGARDLLWYNSSSGKIVFWRMDTSVARISGYFANPPNAGNNNWKVVAAGDYGFGANGLEHTTDIVWRNETSGKLVIWFMDLAGNRTAGAFTTPDTSPAGWTVAGPR